MRRLRTPVVLIVAVVAIAVFLFVRPGGEAPGPPAALPEGTTTQPAATPPGPPGSTTAPEVVARDPSTATAAPTTSPAGEPDAPPADAEQQWRPVLEGFAADFADPGPDWAERISRWTTPHLAETYAAVDPREVPLATLVDLQIGATGAYTVDATATYDTGLTIGLRAELSPDGWQISTVEPLTDGTLTG